eukprot:CAMPEP_0194056534 /NCGR_PEP_ID=MMETSP0009_2-20130614/60471_1 /TAXON_ID=210454 /ORGANISM="Grammatophora oceanica, Strain CCMP 410" /LENGTH=37 /DNA_ID= /DNA_START= /DNA_END= /DNA_ORIENTATION=
MGAEWGHTSFGKLLLDDGRGKTSHLDCHSMIMASKYG